jgi:hypothetical protein
MWRMKPNMILFVLIVRASFFILSCFSHFILQDYDTSTELNYDLPTDQNSSSFCRIDNCEWTRALAKTWDRWDSVHFADIATLGYRFEQNFAFYPLLPTTMRALTSVVGPLLNVRIGFQTDDHYRSNCSITMCDTRTSTIISGLMISQVFSLMAIWEFYALSRSVLPKNGFAEKATLLYAIQPALVFTLAPYTEPLFAFLSFKAHNYLAGSTPRPNLAAIFFSLAAATRSNGALHAAFLLHHSLLHSPLGWPGRTGRRLHPTATAAPAACAWLLWLAAAAGRLLLVAAPCAVFEHYAAALFCAHPPSPRPAFDAVAWLIGAAKPPPPPPHAPGWCAGGTGSLYAHVQVLAKAGGSDRF